MSTRVRDVFQHSTTICNQIVSQNVTNGSNDVNAKQDYGTIWNGIMEWTSNWYLYWRHTSVCMQLSDNICETVRLKRVHRRAPNKKARVNERKRKRQRDNGICQNPPMNMQRGKCWSIEQRNEHENANSTIVYTNLLIAFLFRLI